MRSEWSCWKR